ncbi:MAG: radical SAM family heme chaperone HemW [Spirochaetaceae bacterium]
MNLSRYRPTEPIALYIHVPFCARKCDYCGFFSIRRPSEETMEAVVDATLRQARELLTRLGHPRVRTIYMGGGTPSLPAPRVFARMAEGVLAAAGRDGVEEWTVEGNPESISAEWVSVLADLPVTRVSIGVQSFSADLRAAIGRAGGDRRIGRAVELLLRGGIGSLGIDLMAGIPGQRAQDVVGDVERAIALGVDHVSLYALSVEPGTPFAGRVARGELTLPAEEEVVDAVDAARVRLAEAGIHRYEVSNYARPGRECRHNDAYWLLEPSVGVGPSAVSTLPADGGTALRLTTGGQPEWVSRRSFLLEHFMMGLRRTSGLPARRVLDRFGAEPASFIPRTLARWEPGGRLRLRGGRLSVSGDGMWHLDTLLSEIAAELAST